MATGGAEGARETTEEGAALAERRLLHKAAARVSGPRLELRLRPLNILDEFSRECLTIRVKRKLNSTDVIDALSDLFILRGVPAFVRSDNGPEFVAQAVRDGIAAVGAATACIEPGSPWENGYCESFMYRRPPRCKGQMTWGVGRVRSCIRPVGAAGSWPLALMEYADRGLINGSR